MSSELVQRNRDKNNATAGQFDNRPEVLEGSRRCATALKDAYPFNKENTTVLDFGCGTGMVAAHIAPLVKSLIGVDLSEGVVKLFNERMKNMGYDSSKFRASAAELKGEDGELDGLKFDVVVCCLAFHHLDNIAPTTCMLSSFLNPGGVLLVIDMEHFEVDPTNSEHHHEHQDPKLDLSPLNSSHITGFKEEHIKETFEGAGLQQFQFIRVSHAYMHFRHDCWYTFPDSDVIPPELDEQGNPKGIRFNFFLAKGTKPGLN